MGERRDAPRATRSRRSALGLDLGLTLVDTAEMYGDGGAEEVVGEAIARPARRGLPGRARCCPRTPRGAGHDRGLRALARRGSGPTGSTSTSCTGRARIPLAETLAAFAELHGRGKVRAYGVSNFDTAAMEAAVAAPHGDGIACDQVLYNLKRRGIEWSLLPWCRSARRAGHGLHAARVGRPRRETGPLAEVAPEARRDAPPQVALAWTVREPGVVAIPKAGEPGARARERRGLRARRSTTRTSRGSIAAFPPPRPRAPARDRVTGRVPTRSRSVAGSAASLL